MADITFRNVINGELVDAESGERYDVIDPTTGEVAPSGTLGARALRLVELAPGITEDEVREKTEPELAG